MQNIYNIFMHQLWLMTLKTLWCNNEIVFIFNSSSKEASRHSLLKWEQDLLNLNKKYNNKNLF